MNITGFSIFDNSKKETNKSIIETEDRSNIEETRNIEMGTVPLVNNLVSYGLKQVFSRDIKVETKEEKNPENVNKIKTESNKDTYSKLNEWKEERALEVYKNDNLTKELLENNLNISQGQSNIVPEKKYDPVEYSRNFLKEKEGIYKSGNEIKVQKIEVENSYSASENGKVVSNWNTNSKNFSADNKSEEEIKNIFALKNRNTYNKSLGYIYIDSNIIYNGNKDDDENKLNFQIPFEFNPEISEGGSQANYVSETLLNRIGQYQVYTGTNLSQLSITLKYTALAPDEIDKEMQDNMSKQFSTDSWQYYWTNNRIEEIEYKLRSLVFPDTTSKDYLIRPPMIEIHFNNGSGDGVDSVGDLFKYPIGIDSDNEEDDKKYLSVTRSINGENSNINRYKKYVVTNVQIDNLNDDSIAWPSLYGRVWRDGQSGAPINHIMTAKDFGQNRNGFLGNARRTGFKATLQCIEVTENFLDIVPDFRSYYNAWRFKNKVADITSDYASATLNENIDYTTNFLTASLNSAIYGIASLEESLNLKFEEAYILSLLYKNAKTNNKELWKLNMALDNDVKQLDYYFLNNLFLKNQGSTVEPLGRIENITSEPIFKISAPVSYNKFYNNDTMKDLTGNIDESDSEEIIKGIQAIENGEINIDNSILFGESDIPLKNKELESENGYDIDTVKNILMDSTCKSAESSEYSDIEASLIMKKMVNGKEALDNEAKKYIVDDEENKNNKQEELDYCYKSMYSSEVDPPSSDNWPEWIVDFCKGKTKDELNEVIKNSKTAIEAAKKEKDAQQKIIDDQQIIIDNQQKIIDDKESSEKEKKEAIDKKNEAITKQEAAKKEKDAQQKIIDDNDLIIKESNENIKESDSISSINDSIVQEKEAIKKEISELEEKKNDLQKIINDPNSTESEISDAKKEIKNIDYKIHSKENTINELNRKQEEIDLPKQRKQLFNTFFYYENYENNSPNMWNDFKNLKITLSNPSIEIDEKKDMEMAKTYKKAEISFFDSNNAEEEIIESYTTQDGEKGIIKKYTYMGTNIYTPKKYVKNNIISEMMVKKESGVKDLGELIVKVKNIYKEINEEMLNKGLNKEVADSSVKKLEDLKTEIKNTLFLHHRKEFKLYSKDGTLRKSTDDYFFCNINDTKIKEIIDNLIEKINIISKNIELAKEIFIKVNDSKTLLGSEYRNAFKNLIEWQSLSITNGGVQKVISDESYNNFKYSFMEASQKEKPSKNDIIIEKLKDLPKEIQGTWIMSRPKNYKGESYLNYYNRYNNNELKEVEYKLDKKDMDKYFFEDQEGEEKYYHLYTIENINSQKVFQIGITNNKEVDLYAKSQLNKIAKESKNVILHYIPEEILRKIKYNNGNLYDDYLQKELFIPSMIRTDNFLAFNISSENFEKISYYGNFEKDLTHIDANGWTYNKSGDDLKINIIMDIAKGNTLQINKKSKTRFSVIKKEYKDDKLSTELNPIDVYDIPDIIKEKIEIKDLFLFNSLIGNNNSNWTYENTSFDNIAEKNKFFYDETACSGSPREDYVSLKWSKDEKYAGKCYTFRNIETGEASRISIKDGKIFYFFKDEEKPETKPENIFNMPIISLKSMLDDGRGLTEISDYINNIKYCDDVWSVYYIDSKISGDKKIELEKKLSFKGKRGSKQEETKWNTSSKSVLEKMEKVVIIRNTDGESYQISHSVGDKEYYLYLTEDKKPSYVYNYSKDSSDVSMSKEDFINKIINIFPQKLLSSLKTLFDFEDSYYYDMSSDKEDNWKIFTPLCLFGEEIIASSDSYKFGKEIMPWGLDSTEQLNFYKNKKYKKLINNSDPEISQHGGGQWGGAFGPSLDSTPLLPNDGEYPYNLITIKDFNSGKAYQFGKNIYDKLMLFTKTYIVDLNEYNFKKINLPEEVKKIVMKTLEFTEEEITEKDTGPSKETVNDKINIKGYEVVSLKEGSYRLSNIRDIVISMVKEFNITKKTFSRLYESIKDISSKSLENGYKTVFKELEKVKMPDVSELEVNIDTLSFEDNIKLSEKVLAARDMINLNISIFRSNIKKIYNNIDGLSYEGLQNKFSKVAGRYENSTELPFIKNLKKLSDGYNEYSKSEDSLRKTVFKLWDEVESNKSSVVKKLTSSENFEEDFKNIENGEIPKAYNDVWVSNEKLTQMKVAGDNLNINNLEKLS